MRQITINLTEEDEKNLCKLLDYKKAQIKELLGPTFIEMTQESFLYVCATTGIEQRLSMFE